MLPVAGQPPFQERTFTLPGATYGLAWATELDTAGPRIGTQHAPPHGEPKRHAAGDVLALGGRSRQLLRGRMTGCGHATPVGPLDAAGTGSPGAPGALPPTSPAADGRPTAASTSAVGAAESAQILIPRTREFMFVARSSG